MRVLISGLSSFTGAHIGRAFVDAGYEVAATLTKSLDQYKSPQISERILHSQVTRFFENSSFGSDAFLKSVSDFKPDVFVNHGAAIKGYRDLNFNIANCVALNLTNAEIAFGVLSKSVRLFVHSSSIFEDDAERNYSAISPYGLAKSEIWKKCQLSLDALQMPSARIVIPDPVGAFENLDRMAPVFFSNWKKDISSKIVNPLSVWDHVPAPWLAKVYVQALTDFLESKNQRKTYRPSAFVESNRSWALRLVKLYENYCNKPCPPFIEQGDQMGERVGIDKISYSEREFSDFMNGYAEWLFKNV